MTSRLQAPLRSFTDAATFLGSAQRRRIAHNTHVQRCYDGPEAGIQATLHDNAIALFSPNGCVLFSNAGWPSVTTRDRLNQLSDRLGFVQHDQRQYVIVDRQWSQRREYHRWVAVDPDGTVRTDIETHAAAAAKPPTR